MDKVTGLIVQTDIEAEEIRRCRWIIKKGQWKAALEYLPVEISVVQIAAIQVNKGEPLNHGNNLRLELAGDRLTSARAVQCGL